MKAEDYRRKHKRCVYCKYWRLAPLGYTIGSCCSSNLHLKGFCEVKLQVKKDTQGKFCRVFEAGRI